MKVLEAENIPENADVSRVIENMIAQGAKFIVPASFGYLDPALEVAASHPDVMFDHPAGFKQSDNFHTFWADIGPALLCARHCGRQDDEDQQARLYRRIPDPQCH